MIDDVLGETSDLISAALTFGIVASLYSPKGNNEMYINLPELVTFTGIDENTNFEHLLKIEDYPSIVENVEFGILFSPKSQGKVKRYPSLDFIKQLTTVDAPGLIYAAHICGKYSKEIITTGECSISDFLVECGFKTVQVNTAVPNVVDKITQWANKYGFQVIVQCRDQFPDDTRVSWLYDTSGGRGNVPKTWPKLSEFDYCGYAGGITPDNVKSILRTIIEDNGLDSGQSYWIDMETGIRNEDDDFDPKLCIKVLEQINMLHAELLGS